jgi:lipopolysaccharide exporter
MVKRLADLARTLRQADSFLARILKSGGILTTAGFWENVLRFARNIILAKIIAPDAFGVMATIMASVSVVEALTEVGLKQSVIQHKSGAEEDYLNIVWWLSALRSLAMYAVAYVAAPLIGEYFGRPEMATLLRTGFLVILFNGFVSTRFYVLEKEIQFFKSVLISQGAGLVGILASLLLAFVLRDVWALLSGYLLEAFLRFALSFAFYPTKIRFAVNRSHLADVLTFSRKIFGLPILMMLFMNAQVFIIGRLTSLEALGMYALAYDIADVPNRVLTRVNPLILSAFSIMQDERDRLRESVLQTTEILMMLTLPLVAAFALFARPILSVAYEPHYASVAVPFAVLCLFIPFQMCSHVIMNLFMAIGKPNLHRTASLTRTTLFLVLIYPATKYIGLAGAAMATVIAIAALLVTQLIYLRRALSIGPADYYARWVPGIKLALFLVILPGGLFASLFDISNLFLVVTGMFLCLLAWGAGAYQLNLLKIISDLYRREVTNGRCPG